MRAQHDPEDEPVVAALEPDYFEFDSELGPSPPSSVPVSPCTIAVHKDDLSKEQLKGMQFSGIDNPVS